ncbi:MAG: DEAD/DEAH box helicase, partial [Saprospiraceae bacterium]
ADIIVATPGRLISHIQLGYVNFKRIKFLVLDEADRMLDMGFQPDLLKIFETLSPERQSLLFSATMPPAVLKLSKSLLKDPAMVSIALSKPAEGVTQAAYLVDDRQKLPLIVDLLQDKIGQRILVFGSSKQSVNQLYQKLRAKQLSVGLMSSDLEQEQREQVMMAFRNRQIDVLVATDVVSRGIDVDGIDMVINYDVPRDAEDYVHRIGRTARAARKGEALTLISQTDQIRFRKIEKLIGTEITKLPVPAHLGAAPAHSASRREGPRNGGGDQRKSSTPRGPASSNRSKRRRPNHGGQQKPKNTEG